MKALRLTTCSDIWSDRLKDYKRVRISVPLSAFPMFNITKEEAEVLMIIRTYMTECFVSGDFDWIDTEITDDSYYVFYKGPHLCYHLKRISRLIPDYRFACTRLRRKIQRNLSSVTLPGHLEAAVHISMDQTEKENVFLRLVWVELLLDRYYNTLIQSI